MKRDHFPLFIIIILFNLPLPAGSQSNVGQDEMAVIEQFSHFLEDLRTDLRIPGFSAAIVKDENIIWSEGFGYADIEKKIRATPETVYHLASLTKPFTSIIILKLVEQGKLDLDTPVSEFGIKIYSSGGITVRHLLSHTSEGQPGTLYRYNGDRYLFLGQVIERVSGKTYKEFLFDSILQPLRMNSTAPNITGDKETDIKYAHVYEKLALPYASGDDGQITKGRYYSSFNASAGLVSTVLDMAKFDIAISQNKLLKSELKELAFTPYVNITGEKLPYGLGWFTQVYKGVRLIWHYGYYSPSISTLILKVPDKRMTLILFANTDAINRSFSPGDGDVLTSPVAVVFYRMFIYPMETGVFLNPVNWKSSPDTITEQICQIKSEDAIGLYKLELMSYWRLYRSTGQKELADGLLKSYNNLFFANIPPGYSGQSLIAEIKNVGDLEYSIVKFNLDRETQVHIYGIGEGIPREMYDFGGIEDISTGKLVWLMDYKSSSHAGGDISNRLVDSTIILPKGIYRLHFKTDAAHSYEQWTSFPPDHHFWGISIYEGIPHNTEFDTLTSQQRTIISPEEINSSGRLLDSVTAGQNQVYMVNPVLKLITIICGMIFIFWIILLPVGVVISLIKKSSPANIQKSKEKNRLLIAGMTFAWINAVLGALYVIIVVLNGASEYLLTNGFDDSMAGEVRLVFIILPLASLVISTLLIVFTFLFWKQRVQSFIVRLFYTLFAIVSFFFILIYFHNYLLLYK